MDEVLLILGATSIEGDKTCDSQNEYKDLYKNIGKFGNQEQRRKDLLETQKKNRYANLDSYRGILEIVQRFEQNESQKFKVAYRPTLCVAGFTKKTSYSNLLMLSEWIIEKPQDFNENWYVVPCPIGNRVLVVANRGRTTCYTKNGRFKFSFRSALPGGNRCDSSLFKNYTVLDCFYNEETNTIYVLDLLAWNNQPMTDCETEFRRYWLSTKFSELPELQNISKKNNYIFTLLPMVDCTSESLNKFMMTYPAFPENQPQLDGLLFYHKSVHYVSGETPLVGWLYPYMVPELLGEDITVHNDFKALKPNDYTNQKEFIVKFEEEMNRRKIIYSKSVEMDTTEVQSDNTKMDDTANEENKQIDETIEVDISEHTIDDKKRQEKNMDQDKIDKQM